MAGAKRRAEVIPHGGLKTTRCMAGAKRRAGFAFLNPSKLFFCQRKNKATAFQPKLWLAGWLAGSSSGWLPLAGWRWVAGPGLAGRLWLAGHLASTGGRPPRILWTGLLGGSGQLARKVPGWRLPTLCAGAAMGPSLIANGEPGI